MNILNLKKLMLVPFVCCISIQQTEAKVIYSSEATATLQREITKNEKQEEAKSNCQANTIQLLNNLDTPKNNQSADEARQNSFISLVKNVKKYTEVKQEVQGKEKN